MTGELAGSRILVTGGAGLIGRATIAALSQAGAEAVSFDLAPAPGALGVRSVVGDLRDREAVARAVAGMDAVVHLGGIAGPDLADDITVYEVNTLGTYSVLSAAAAAGVGKVVYASSINANGRPIGQLRPPEVFPYDEELPAAIADSYSLSKQANEAAARMAHDRWGLRCTGLRFPLVRDLFEEDGRRFAAHLRQALSADPIRQAYEGWSYLDASDAAVAVLQALTHDTPPAPGILIAAPLTYLAQDTTAALAAVLPGTAAPRLHGRQVGLDLTRSHRQLEFRARVALEDLGAELLAPGGLL